MGQTRLGSFAEAWANIAVGFAINFTANMIVLPMFGLAITAGKAFGIGLVFTAISLARQYVLRRWFNGLKFGNTPAAPVKKRALQTGPAMRAPAKGRSL